MSSSPVSLPAPNRVDPERLAVLLAEAGWRLVGGRSGIYNRFAPPGDDYASLHGALIIPLDTSAPDYADQIAGALKELSSAPYLDSWLRIIAPRLSAHAADRFCFRKEAAAPSGLIPWSAGEDLILSARQSLIAQPKKLRVRMESIDDYNEAVRAHGEDLAVRATGTLARERTLNWLYGARLVEVLGSVELFMGWDEPDPPISVSDDFELLEIDPVDDSRGGTDSA